MGETKWGTSLYLRRLKLPANNPIPPDVALIRVWFSEEHLGGGGGGWGLIRVWFSEEYLRGGGGGGSWGGLGGGRGGMRGARDLFELGLSPIRTSGRGGVMGGVRVCGDVELHSSDGPLS